MFQLLQRQWRRIGTWSAVETCENRRRNRRARRELGWERRGTPFPTCGSFSAPSPNRSPFVPIEISFADYGQYWRSRSRDVCRFDDSASFRTEAHPLNYLICRESSTFFSFPKFIRFHLTPSPPQSTENTSFWYFTQFFQFPQFLLLFPS